jgi:hypothetical protein
VLSFFGVLVHDGAWLSLYGDAQATFVYGLFFFGPFSFL